MKKILITILLIAVLLVSGCAISDYLSGEQNAYSLLEEEGAFAPFAVLTDLERESLSTIATTTEVEDEGILSIATDTLLEEEGKFYTTAANATLERILLITVASNSTLEYVAKLSFATSTTVEDEGIKTFATDSLLEDLVLLPFAANATLEAVRFTTFATWEHLEATEISSFGTFSLIEKVIPGPFATTTELETPINLPDVDRGHWIDGYPTQQDEDIEWFKSPTTHEVGATIYGEVLVRNLNGELTDLGAPYVKIYDRYWHEVVRLGLIKRTTGRFFFTWTSLIPGDYTVELVGWIQDRKSTTVRRFKVIQTTW